MIEYLAANVVAAVVFLLIAMTLYFTPIGRWLSDLANVWRQS